MIIVATFALVLGNPGYGLRRAPGKIDGGPNASNVATVDDGMTETE